MSTKQTEALKLALEALGVATTPLAKDRQEVLRAQAAIREALAEQLAQQSKLSDYEPDGMHHNKPQKRPQNCGTGHCSCIECLFEQPAQQQEPEFAAPGGGYVPAIPAPPASKPWVGLTEEDMYEIGEFKNTHGYVPTGAKRLFAAVEAKLREKNA